MLCPRWISLNLEYIRAVNAGNDAEVIRFFDRISDDKRYFTKKRYIWNIIRGKEFCRIVANWVIEWYRISSTRDDGTTAMCDVLNVLHWIMTSENHERVKKSLVWKITKDAPILTIDTLPHVSPERLINILNSDRWIVTDDALRPIINGYIELELELASAKSSLAAMEGLLSN